MIAGIGTLVREDGLSQVEAARLLGRHKSWVNHRLAMLERLCEAAVEELRVGLLTPAVARQLTWLLRGNQAVAVQTAREASLTSRELSGVLDLLLASSTREQTSFVLDDPGTDPGAPPDAEDSAEQLDQLLASATLEKLTHLQLLERLLALPAQ